ncbi:DUF5671 domain-containing protein [Agrococcus sp. ProA11]|uniref:DUF5671 domain-containing protein n=1 Tax=Agrococcus chionoecetis TaxID=3153752 RepID=UPI0032604B73
MSAVEAPVVPDSSPRGAQSTVRRVIVYAIFFALVAITANGVSGLLGRLLETRTDLGSGEGGLALSLAFTLIGGPLAIALWWLLWRRLEGADRASVSWGLYVGAMTFVSLVTFSTALLGALADLIRGDWAPEALATAIAWLAVWILHRLMSAHRSKGPVRLSTVPSVLGAAYGLILTIGGAILALQIVFGAALLPGSAQIGDPWWQSALQALVWAVGGAAVWWLHWMRDGVCRLTGGFAAVALVITGVFGGAAVTLGGVGTALYVGLRAAFDRGDGWRALLDPLPLAAAAAAVGAVVWLYHRRIAQERSEGTRSAARLVEAGIGLIGAASGIGVIVNALLAALSTPLAGNDARALLLGGIASLVVGAPVWWRAWRPLDTAKDAGATGRRVYLVAVFGVSAVVAIVALLVIGFRIFEFTLDGGAGDGFVERIRAPFGLLLATALVASYHFAIWRRDRAAAPGEARARAIDRVILVTIGDASALEDAIRAATGASVTRWVRADASEAPAATSANSAAEGSAEAVAAALRALEGLTARRVLLVTGPGERVVAIPLAD